MDTGNKKRLAVLIVVVILYLCMGGVLFSNLEAGAEKSRMTKLQQHLEDFLDNSTCVSRDDLYKVIDHAVHEKELVVYVIKNITHLVRWDFGGAFGFSVSVVTTIGFGNMAPKTIGGKIACVVYALVGIPVTVLMLSGLGQQLAALSNRVNKLKLCSKKPVVNNAINMVLIIVMGLVVMFLGPAFIFHLVEEWNIMEALYFCFTTLSTIGFGDYIIGIHEKQLPMGPIRDSYEIMAYVWILIGLAYLSLVIKYISGVLVHNASRVERRTIRRFENELGRLHNEILLNGPVSTLRINKQNKSANCDIENMQDNPKNVQLVRMNHI